MCLNKLIHKKLVEKYMQDILTKLIQPKNKHLNDNVF